MSDNAQLIFIESIINDSALEHLTLKDLKRLVTHYEHSFTEDEVDELPEDLEKFVL